MAEPFARMMVRRTATALGFVLLLAAAVATGLAASTWQSAPAGPVQQIAFDDLGPRPGFDL